MPSSHIELGIRSTGPQALRSDSFTTIKISRLRVMPQIAPVKPLIAVIIHLRPKCYAWWESAIAQSGEGANAWDFVNVSYKKHVTLLRGLYSSQGQQDLIEESVSDRGCEISVSPRCLN